MEIIPAIDIREGDCVQLIGGDENKERMRLNDPQAQLEHFIGFGAERIHIVDLDRALGTGNDNLELIRSMLNVGGNLRLQVGGGLSQFNDIEKLLEYGADKVVLGTKAIKDPKWLAEACDQFENKVIVAIDARDEDVVINGWKKFAGHTIFEAARFSQEAGASGVLYTDVEREGLLQGPNTDRCAQLAKLNDIEVLASGGIANYGHIEELANSGADGAIIGTAAYTGSLALRGLFD